MESADTLTFLFLCLLLFCFSFLGGLLPLKLHLHNATIEWLNIMASGVLIGTGLTVIIPEGVTALEESSSSPNKASATLGYSLLFGFLFMVLSDWVVGGHQHSQAEAYEPVDDSPRHSQNGLTLGLTIHALADGLAFSASRSSSLISAKASMLILMALFFHRLPATLSLVILLKTGGQSKQTILRALTLFAAASPCAMIATFLVLRIMERSSATDFGLSISALCLLFSAGTFLYVSCVHILGGLATKSLSLTQLMALCLSSLLPVVLINLD